MFKTRVSTPSQNGVQEGMEEGSLPLSSAEVPNPEVVEKAKRRKFSKRDKLRILKAADGCTRPGELGGLLRSEGVYSSYLTRWRQQVEAGQLGTKKRGRPETDPSVKELVRLRGENVRLAKKLEQAEIIIDVQKKLSDLLGLQSEATGKGEDT